MRRALRNAGLRITPTRLSTFRVMNAANEALDASEILGRVLAAESIGRPSSRVGAEPVIDRVTVYRTLNTFVEKGLAHKVDPGDRVFRFSLTDHARCADHKHDHEHPHLICDSCGSVRCMPDAQVVIQSKPGTPGQRGRAAPAPRVVRQQDVTVRGTCEECEGETGKGPRAEG
ncbi:MAG: transcriptional repressor [Phycisphaerales bacterium]|nr:transcriptional repressor [Phycisphaerales bacterium]